MLATGLSWSQIEEALARRFGHESGGGEVLRSENMFGSIENLVGAVCSNTGRPKLPIRLMASLLFLMHSFNLSDEELVVRCSESVLW